MYPTVLNERERLGSTGLGYGIAIRMAIKCSAAAGAFYRLQTPLEFEAPDNKPVTLCFICILVPKEADEKTFAGITRRAR